MSARHVLHVNNRGPISPAVQDVARCGVLENADSRAEMEGDISVLSFEILHSGHRSNGSLINKVCFMSDFLLLNRLGLSCSSNTCLCIS